MYFIACQREAPKVGDIINTARRNLSPHIVDISGITFYQSSQELKEKLHGMRCEEKDHETQICTWKAMKEDRESGFSGIDKIQFTFYRDTLQSIKLQYLELFDVEYVNFERGVREKYAYAIAGKLLDTTGTEWQYDSLKVILTPNKKQHWTGSFFAFTPVLELQERNVYRRWLDAIEKQKTKTVY